MRTNACNYPKWIDEKLGKAKSRLEIYYQREEEMLSKNGVKSYGVGSRNVQRYDTALTEVAKTIKELEKEISYLENLKLRGATRKAVGVVPRDY